MRREHPNKVVDHQIGIIDEKAVNIRQGKLGTSRDIERVREMEREKERGRQVINAVHRRAPGARPLPEYPQHKRIAQILPHFFQFAFVQIQRKLSDNYEKIFAKSFAC